VERENLVANNCKETAREMGAWGPSWSLVAAGRHRVQYEYSSTKLLNSAESVSQHSWET
jgi:hypothetical protein